MTLQANARNLLEDKMPGHVCGNTTAYNFFKRFAETEGRGKG